MRPAYRVWLLVAITSVFLPQIFCKVEEKAEILDACDLSTDPSGFIYCNCDGGDIGAEATGLVCGVNRPFEGRESAPEWDAISSAFNANHLEFTTLVHTQINSFPPTRIFLNLKLLNYCKISNGNIETIPSHAFSNSTSIASISLASNRIRHLAKNAFANMINLTNLQLEDNALTEIKRGVFVNLPNLKNLHLERNLIHTVHDNAFRDLGALETLELQSNNISTITPEVFAGLENLKRLDLMRNAIPFLGNDVFKAMPHLDDLDLTENQINALAPHAFRGLKELSRLNLKGNKIVKFMPATFSDSRNLYFLDLRLNALDSLSKDTFHEEVYEKLKSPNMGFMVEGNRLQCDCSIVWLARLWNETASQMVRDHLDLTSCDVPQKYSRSYDEEDVNLRSRGRTPGNVTFIGGPVEETTTYKTGSTLKVAHLNAEDLNCKGPRGKGKKGKSTRNGSKAREEEPLGRTQESLLGQSGPSEPQEQEQLVEPEASSSARIQTNCVYFALLIFPSLYYYRLY